ICYDPHHRQSKGNIHHGKGENQHSAHEKKKNRGQFRMLKDIRKNEEKKSSRDNRNTTMKCVSKAKPMLKGEPYGADKKQQDSGDQDDPGSKWDFSENRIGRF